MPASWIAGGALLLCAIAQVESKVHKVTVGNGGFRYNPNTTIADVGDIIEFEFFPPNHSVIRSMYTSDPNCPGGYCNPCVPWTLYNPNGNASHFFSSGLRDVSQSEINNPPSWNLTINDTRPIFFYCDAPGSCHPNGMVGVINPNRSVSLANQFAAAVNADYQLNPGDQFPAEGETPTATATPIPASASSTASGSQGQKHSSGLSGGAIAGIVVGCVAAVVLGGLVLYFCGKSRAYSELFKHSRHEADRYEAAEAEKAATQSESGQTASVGGWVAGQDGKGHTSPNTQSMHSGWTHPSTGANLSPALPQNQSPNPEGGQFIGYNRQSGAPEFAVEAPYHNDQGQIAELGGTEAPKKTLGDVPEVHGDTAPDRKT